MSKAFDYHKFDLMKFLQEIEDECKEDLGEDEENNECSQNYDFAAQIQELFREFRRLKLYTVEGIPTVAPEAHDLIRRDNSIEQSGKTLGYVFYVHQDVHELETGELYLGWGGWHLVEHVYENEETGEEKEVIEYNDVEVSDIVIQAIKNIGTRYEWNEDQDTRIHIFQNDSEGE